MPARTIAVSLDYINWTVLAALAAGCFAAVAVLRLRTTATRGFLAFTAFVATLLGVVALLVDLALPLPDPSLAIVPSPQLDELRRALLGAFVALAGLDVVLIAARRRALLVDLAAVTAAVAALAVAAVGWSGGTAASVPVVVQFVFLAAASGGVLAALILGHWYLVTPRLSEQPLVVLARLLLLVVGLQALLYGTWVTTGANVGRLPFQPLVGPEAFFVWMRFVVGIGLPLFISWAAVQTARSRSMESATGLLYIDVGLIASGTILAAGLYFGTGLLV